MQHKSRFQSNKSTRTNSFILEGFDELMNSASFEMLKGEVPVNGPDVVPEMAAQSDSLLMALLARPHFRSNITSPHRRPIEPRDEPPLIPPIPQQPQSTQNNIAPHQSLHQSSHQVPPIPQRVVEVKAEPPKPDLRPIEQRPHVIKFREDSSPHGYNKAELWSNDEHERFVEAVARFGRKKQTQVAKFVRTRDVKQVISHSQKFFKKLQKAMGTQPVNQYLVVQLIQIIQKLLGKEMKQITQFERERAFQIATRVCGAWTICERVEVLAELALQVLGGEEMQLLRAVDLEPK